MIPTEAWQAFGGVAAVVILLGGLALALQRLGLIRTRAVRPDNERTHLEARVAALEEVARRVDRLEREFQEHRLCVAENYVRRDDWVPMTSRVIGMLEDHTQMLARLDERTRSTGTRGEAREDG